MISQVDIIIGTLVGLVGLAVLVFLLRQLLPEFGSWIRRGFGQLAYRRAQERLVKIDQLLESDRHDLALKEIEHAFVLKGAMSKELAATIRDHNHGLLSRCLIISEQLSGRLTNLADVERLLEERSELHLLFLKTDETLRRIADRRETAGKDIPNWGKKDFHGRLQEIRKELLRNESALLAAIRQLLRAIQTPTGRDITYH